MKTKRLTLLSMLLAISIVLAIVETFLPPIPVPGVKLGLANVVTLIILVIFNRKDAFIVLMIRIVLVALLRGNIFNISFFLSLSGGIMAYILMILSYKFKYFSLIGVSISGAFGHSLGQIIMAIFLLSTPSLIYYFPYILLLSIGTGVVTGYIAIYAKQIMLKLEV
jgi:heptaprenyl diphosphate synthase